MMTRVGALIARKRAGISSHLLFKAFSTLKFPSKPWEIILSNFFLECSSIIGCLFLFCIKKVSKA